MKNLLLLSIFYLLSSFCLAQSGYQIRIKTEIIDADSLFIKTYNVKDKKFHNFISLKFEKDITIKDKIPLNSGIYIIAADSAVLSEFLISDTKNQKFTISFLPDDIKVEGSKENSANLAYTKQMKEYKKQLMELDFRLQQMQQQGMPVSLIQAYVDTFLNAQYTEKLAYQKKIISENKEFLLASIIQCSIEVPPPPQEYFRSQVKYFTYFSDRFFDNHKWDDERLLQTPVLYKQFNEFSQHIARLEPEITIPIVLKALKGSKVNRNFYFTFFDYLEHFFGKFSSPYRDVLLYIEMLKDILTTQDLEETRRLFYEHELKLITKNRPGEQALDFNILLSNGDTTHLYDIQSEILLLYFQNPDCHSCGEFRERMKNIESLYFAVSLGRLKVLTIYFEDNEDLWRNYLKTEAFTSWTHGWNYDLRITEERLYDIRNIPTIMILDKNKKVIKTDIFPNELEEWFKKNL
jgi:hypothetical protein